MKSMLRSPERSEVFVRHWSKPGASHLLKVTSTAWSDRTCAVVRLYVQSIFLISLERVRRPSAEAIVIGPVCLWVGLLPRQLEIACIDPHQTGFVGKGSDHLQLIKFWPSRAPGKGVCGRARMLGSNLLQPAYYAVFASPLSAFSLIFADLMGRLALDRLCKLFLRCHDMLVGHRRRYGGIGPPPPQRKIGVEETLMSMFPPKVSARCDVHSNISPPFMLGFVNWFHRRIHRLFLRRIGWMKRILGTQTLFGLGIVDVCWVEP